MKNKRLEIVATGIGILVFILIFSGQVFADEVTVVGMVNDNYQIVTEGGTVYEVADTDMGNDMLNHVGSVVEASGTVTEEEGLKVIKVRSYLVIEGKPRA